MSSNWNEGYFPSPSTPIRQDHLTSPSPTKGFGSGGSVSSSQFNSPPKSSYNHHDEAGGSGPDEGGPMDSPAVQQLKRATGFASVRVGLGSPQLSMNRDWSNIQRKGSGGTSDHTDIITTGPTGGNEQTGSSFPTPPGTESDIAQPPPVISRHSSQTHNSPHQESPPRPPRHPRRTSSTHLPSLPDPDSPGPSSQASSPRLRSQALHRSSASIISRSTSTSSVPGLDPVQEGVVHHSRAGSSSSGIHQSTSRTSVHRSPRPNIDYMQEQREILASPSPSHSRSGSVSPRKSHHQRSPSLPVESASRRPPYRSHISNSSTASRRPIEETEEPKPSPRSPVGATLDERIRHAEEKIRQSTQRRPRTADASQTHRAAAPGTLRQHDSVSRNAHSPSAYTSSTLRRSATLSSASVLTPNGDPGSDSSGRRHAASIRTNELHDFHEREQSGGSGSSGRRKPIPSDFRNGGLFTPSPKAGLISIDTSPAVGGSGSQRRLDRVKQSPEEAKTYSSARRYITESRMDQVHTSPLDRVRGVRQSEIDGLPRTQADTGERLSDGAAPAKRHWRDSISGLPPRASELGYNGLPATNGGGGASVRRAESVLGTAGDRYRYQSRGGSAESALGRDRYGTSKDPGTLTSRSSKYALGPGDSVSVVGASRADYTASTRKDPLEVIRRIEQSRAEHQKQWEVERSASAIGDLPNSSIYPRPSSRLFDSTPRRARPATSMASMRDAYDQAAPRTAPTDDWRTRRNQVIAPTDSPLIGRGGPRPAHQPIKPATDPRPLRSSTSMGSRLDIGLDIATPSTEHGRLLFEACRALELKLGPEIVDQLPDLLKTFQWTARSAETVNGSIRDAVKRADDANVYLDLDDLDRARDEMNKLVGFLRDASRTSDQNVRELTKVLLDLPKLLRQADRAGTHRATHRASMDFDRRPSPDDQHPTRSATRYDASPARASHDMMRPSTSMGMGESTSPLHRYSLDSRRSVLQPRTQPRDRERNSTVSNLVAKMRGLTPRNSPLPQRHSDLQPIEQSPPNPIVERLPSRSPTKSATRSSLALTTSPTKSSLSLALAAPPPPPKSPERRNVLRKKTSALSSHTVRGSSSSFMPTSSKVTTTTAISTFNAGDLEAELTPAKSIRSFQTYSTHAASEDLVGSPSSRYSFGPGSGPGPGPEGVMGRNSSEFSAIRGSMDSTEREDAVSVLEHSLVAAARKREEDDRRPSMGERFRASLRRNGSGRVKD